jgi:uncharacterized C2H2 Zn-finger protein
MDRLTALKAGDTLEFWRNDDPKCPHCGTVVSVSDHELWALYEEGEHEVECPNCDMTFAVSTSIAYSFSTDEQDDPEEYAAPAPGKGGEA